MSGEPNFHTLVPLRFHVPEEAAIIAETAALDYRAHRDGAEPGEERYWPTLEVREGVHPGPFESDGSDFSASGEGTKPEPAPAWDDEETWLRRAHIPVRHQLSAFAGWSPRGGTAPIEACQSWCRQWPPLKPWLVLTGDAGRGKTHLAVATARYLALTRGTRSRFWTVDRLEARYKATYGEDATETEAQIDQEIMRMPLLIVDDLGATKHTEWSEGKLFMLLNARWNDAKPTIFTMNVAPEKLGHERLSSRLLDRSASVVVAFSGPDYRRTS